MIPEAWVEHFLQSKSHGLTDDAAFNRLEARYYVSLSYDEQVILWEAEYEADRMFHLRWELILTGVIATVALLALALIVGGR